MNKLKKIGLSALAGSLVAISANAVEVRINCMQDICQKVLKGKLRRNMN